MTFLPVFVIQNDNVLLCCKCGCDSKFLGRSANYYTIMFTKTVQLFVCVLVRMCVCIKRKFVSDSNEVVTVFSMMIASNRVIFCSTANVSL